MFGIVFARDEEAARRFITGDVSAEWHESVFVATGPFD
jgi:hypothetical protein